MLRSAVVASAVRAGNIGRIDALIPAMARNALAS
jgi:hypothetical protein